MSEETKKVRVHQIHTHAGVEYPAGSEVSLPAIYADQLMAMEGERRATEIKAIEKRKKIMDAPAE